VNYYELLGLQKEPFSTTPDPYFFFRSRQHQEAIDRLEIALRLRRGLNLIIGDVGSGKTTLARVLLQNFAGEDNFQFFLILDPVFRSEYQFLRYLVEIFQATPRGRSTLDYRNALESYLLHAGVEEGKVVVLIIDEGQKLTPSYIETIRTLLNFETNEYKLLQVIILGQLELLPRIRRKRNFMDRINLSYMINPLSLNDTQQMIQFRLQRAGFHEGQLFTEEAVALIQDHSKGSPRKITLMCHHALETLIMQDRGVVAQDIIEELISTEVT
jgi:general secretion pathway protein A